MCKNYLAKCPLFVQYTNSRLKKCVIAEVQIYKKKIENKQINNQLDNTIKKIIICDKHPRTFVIREWGIK